MADIDYDKIDSELLNSEDLQDVLEELSSISNRADKLGIALGLAAGSFDNNMQSVIMTWLEQDYNTGRHGLPSYRKLVKAVASKIGARNPALANKIAANHPAGAVPQEPMETQPQAVASDDHHGTVGSKIQTEGFSDIFEKLLPSKPKDVPLALRPYQMDKSPHGLCLIINNMHFDGKPNKTRTGSDQDEKRFAKCMPELGYKLFEGKVHKDKTVKEMVSLLESAADSDHSNYDSFVCFLASHGSPGVLHGADNRNISLDEIQAIFTRSKTLIGKPKIFFIQACRGQELPGGRYAQDDGEDDDPVLLPRDSDFFFGYATSPDTKACRFTDIGSWYVIELCKALKEYSKYLDLQSMVTAAHCEVATNKEYTFEIHGKSYKQCPQQVSTLLRPVYFKRNN